MGAKCLRAYEDLGGDEALPEYAKRLARETANTGASPRTMASREREVRQSPKRDPARSVGKPLFRVREGDEELIDPDRGDLGSVSAVEVRETSRLRSSLAGGQLSWFKASPQPVSVTVHVYNIGTASIGRVLNRILKPLGTGAFHCGVEVYGCEWSYSDTTTGIGDGVFPSRPMRCEGHDYAESVLMGKTATSEEEVVQLVRLLKKEWPVQEYDTLKRNCCHFSNELCQRLGVGSIPSWIMNLAGAGAAIAATGDMTCCRQMAVQVCCGESVNGGDPDDVEVVDVVEQMPVLPRTGWSTPRQTSTAGRAKEKQ